MSRKIKLTQGQYAIVDDIDYNRLIKYKWFALKDSCNWYARSTINLDNRKNKTLFMHREVLKAQGGQIIDHINRNTLDNRSENLRFCTYQQNQFNRTMNKNNTSGFKGVNWNKRDKKWYARIAHKGVKFILDVITT